MTIQTRINDGVSVKTRTYREIAKGSPEYCRRLYGFMKQADICKWGEMIQLKGTERIVLAHFGKVEQ